MAVIPPPAQSDDQTLTVPNPAVFLPTRDDALAAMQFSRDVLQNMGDYASALKHDHAILGQAVATDLPLEAPPPWFQPALDQALRRSAAGTILAMRSEARELWKSLNHARGDGTVAPFVPVPFTTGFFPSEQGFPVLRSVNDIEGLNDERLVNYLVGYGIQDPVVVPEDPDATRRARVNWLKHVIGAVGI